MASGRSRRQLEDKGPGGAWIAAAAVVLAAVLAGLFALINPIVQDWYKERSQAKAQAQAQADAQAEATKKAAELPPKKGKNILASPTLRRYDDLVNSGSSYG